MKPQMEKLAGQFRQANIFLNSYAYTLSKSDVLQDYLVNHSNPYRERVLFNRLLLNSSWLFLTSSNRFIKLPEYRQHPYARWWYELLVLKHRPQCQWTTWMSCLRNSKVRHANSPSSATTRGTYRKKCAVITLDPIWDRQRGIGECLDRKSNWYDIHKIQAQDWQWGLPAVYVEICRTGLDNQYMVKDISCSTGFVVKAAPALIFAFKQGYW